MGDKTGIEWTQATWNPLVGCTKVSAGCDNCYAENFVNRFAGTSNAFPNRFDVVTMRSDRFLEQPLRWRSPKRIFVNSLADLFHDDVPDEFVAKVFAVMALATHHTFQLLTKRHARMRALLRSTAFEALVAQSTAPLSKLGPSDWNAHWTWPLPNLWVGVSVENQQWADIRIPALLDTPAAVRFISAEPLLGPIDLDPWASNGPPWSGLNWVIVGGESGRGARPMYADWVRSLRDQCQQGGTAFLFKQWGEWQPQTALSAGYLSDPRECHGEIVEDGKFPTIEWRRLYRRVGKKAAGRELDGRTWDEYPVSS